MKYYNEQMKIRSAYLQSRLELELSKLNSTETAIEAMKTEILQIHDENMKLIQDNHILKCKEFPVGEMNSGESNKINNICNRMNMVLKITSDDRDSFKQQKNMICESYKNVMHNIIDTTEFQKNYNNYFNVIKETYERVKDKATEIADYNNYIEGKKKEWSEKLQEKQNLFDLLCDIEKEQKESIQKKLKHKNESEMETDQVNKTALLSDSTENQMLVVMEQLKALSNLKIADT